MKKSIGAGTLAVPSPVWVVGTYDDNGRPNMMTAAWGGICCSRPPCIYVSLVLMVAYAVCIAAYGIGRPELRQSVAFFA